MKHGKKLPALLLLAALLLSSFSALVRAENADPAIPGNIPEIIMIEQEETGAADSLVRYPDVGTMNEENKPAIEAIHQAIQEKARIPEYLQLLSTIQEGSTGLRFDYEITCPCNPWDAPLMNDSRYLSLLFSAEGKMLQGRPSQVYYPMTFDLLTGELVAFDDLFTDPEGAKAFIEAYLEEEIEPTLSTYLENNQLFPVPYDRFFLDGNDNILLVYENSQLSFLSGYSGAISFRYSELEPWLDASPGGVPMQLSELFYLQNLFGDLWDEDELFWEQMQDHNLVGLYPTVCLNDDAEMIRQRYRCTVDSGYYPGGAYFEAEEPRLRGTLILTDESEETVTGILTHRADLPGIVTGKTTLSDAEAFLGVSPALRMDVSKALAGIYLVCPGTASVYQFQSIDGEPLSLTLYADENGVVQYVKYAIEQ